MDSTWVESEEAMLQRYWAPEQARKRDIVLEVRASGLNQVDAVDRIMNEFHGGVPTEPQFDPADLPKNELIPEFPVAWIKPRHLGLDGDAAIHDDSQYRLLEKSIRLYGFTEPILLNPDYSVAHGQLRYEVAKLMGLATVPVMLAPEAARLYVLFANQIPRWGRWDNSITDLLLLNPSKIDANMRILLREFSWFVNDVPTHLTSPSFILEAVARQIVLNKRAKIYEFKPTDLLFVEPTRMELLHFWDTADEYKELAERARANDWDLGSFKSVGTQEELDAAITDVLNFIADNLKRNGYDAEEE